MKANRHGRRLDGDERGSFIVLEAILVAALVLTAILFFTSIQRPTTGSEAGGLDLARYAADTLQLLQVHDFEGKEFEEWVTILAEGSNATVYDEVNGYLGEIVPGGVKYSLRIHNGVGPQQIAPTGPTEIPRAARAASISFLPDWAEFETNVATRIVMPGQFIPSTDATNKPLVEPGSTTYRCFESPNGAVRLRDGPDSGTAVDSWNDHWKAIPDPTDATSNTPWKATGVELGTSPVNFQVPTDLPLGVWRISGTAGDDADGDCNSSPSYVNVVPPGSLRILTDAQTFSTGVLTRVVTTSSSFLPTDVGKPISGDRIPLGATILFYDSPTQVRMSANALSGGACLAVGIGIDSPYRPYTLELVLWFGA